MTPDTVGQFVVAVAVIGVVFGAYTGVVAQEKGYSGGAWFAGGFFFSIVALIAAAGLPMKKKD
jgi:hypothetical protein